MAINWDETVPQGTQPVNVLDKLGREVRIALRQRLEMEHNFPGSTPTSDDCYHKFPHSNYADFPAANDEYIGRVRWADDHGMLYMDLGVATGWLPAGGILNADRDTLTDGSDASSLHNHDAIHAPLIGFLSREGDLENWLAWTDVDTHVVAYSYTRYFNVGAAYYPLYPAITLDGTEHLFFAGGLGRICEDETEDPATEDIPRATFRVLHSTWDGANNRWRILLGLEASAADDSWRGTDVIGQLMVVAIK